MRTVIAMCVVLGTLSNVVGAQQATRTRRPSPAPAPAPAPAAKAPLATSKGTRTSLGVRIGTLGLGADLSRLVTDHIGVRASANVMTLNRQYFEEQRRNGDPFNLEDNVNWDITVKNTSFSGMLDFYPGARGSFRISAGAMTNPFKGDGVGAITQDSTYILIGAVRPASVVGDLLASVRYANVLPYVGLGFGTPASKARGLSVTFDIGAAIGRPTVSLTSTTAATTTHPSLVTLLARREADWQADYLDKAPVYPVLSLGLAYRF